MEAELGALAQATPQAMHVLVLSDVSAARQAAKATATASGFDELAAEEIALVASELASNLVKHAGGGTLTLTRLADGGRAGIEIESVDSGPGIANGEQALADGFSTTGSLGIGLGAVNRLMDELKITSPLEPGGGTRIVCRRWVRKEMLGAKPCPLAFGAATRAHPSMAENGDSFVIKRWDASALVGVIDGLGHGQFAQRAAQTARLYAESHCDQPLEAIFRGIERSCRATRGVVMALARFDFGSAQPSSPFIRLTFASVGNVEARVFGSPQPVSFNVRRGVMGANAPLPVVTRHDWNADNILVLHSDGLRTHWRWEDLNLAQVSATVAAQRLLHAQAKNDDDATVVVVKGQHGR